MKLILKKYICCFLAVLLFFGFCFPSFVSYADDVSAVGVNDDLRAALFAVLFSMNLVIEPVGAVWEDSILHAVDPLGLVPALRSNNFIDYLDQSVIKVLPDTILIDGIEYSQIWLGPDAAEALRLEGLDFASLYNILNNQDEAIQYATGFGSWHGIPLYNVSGDIISPFYVVAYGSASDAYISNFVGGLTVDLWSGHPSGTSAQGRAYVTGGPVSGFITINKDRTMSGLVRARKNGSYIQLDTYNSSVPNSRIYYDSNYISSPFEFDYTSGIIDAPKEVNDGLLITVPSQGPDNSYYIPDVVRDYPELTQPGGRPIVLDPELNPDYEVDVDIGNDIGELLRLIITLLTLLPDWEIEFAPEPEVGPEPSPEPVPPPSPEPSVPISEVPADWLDQILRWIQETIKAIQTAIQSATETLIQTLTEIKTKLQDILDHIRQGHIDLFINVLDVIKSFFAPVFGLLRAALGLWHYVVEWVQATAPVFSTFIGFMSGTSYNLVLPIYAALAGPICIAIYKRFGR